MTSSAGLTGYKQYELTIFTLQTAVKKYINIILSSLFSTELFSELIEILEAVDSAS
jgi:hypothetical protein